MKKTLVFILLCLVLMLSACAGENAVTLNGNTVKINAVDLSVAFPEDFSILTGDEVYNALYQGISSDVGSAEDLKKSLEEDGTHYLAQATGTWAVAVITTQKMTPDDGEGRVSLEVYTRRVHDTSIFEYYASGYKTNSDVTSLTEETIGGRSGYLSHFEVVSDDETPQFIFGLYEFFFENKDHLYMIQVMYFEEDCSDKALSIINSLS